MNLWLEALVLGLFLSIMTGPVFFALMDLTLQRGFWPAVCLAAGVWLSDITYISLVFLGLTYISENPNFTYWVGIIGGLILILFGISTMKSKSQKQDFDLNLGSYLSFFSKGYAINIFNPFVFLFWIGIVSNITGGSHSIQNGLIYLFIILFTVGALDIVKIYVADKIKQGLREKHFYYMRIVAGLGLIAFGISLIYKSVMA